MAAADKDVLPLVVDGLHFKTRDRSILRDVSFRLDDPGISVIMGPNGAGKSVLMRCLHGLIAPTAGQITWSGHAITANIKRRQAMVFQRPVLLRRTVIANVRFAQKAQNITDNGDAETLLTAVRLADLAEQPARKLSGGEQQRLALARALATRPDILLLDEPTANLDPASTRIIEDLVTRVSARGVKVLFVTHNVHQAERLADEIVFLSDGQVCEHRGAAEFFSAPQSIEAEAYLQGRLPEI